MKGIHVVAVVLAVVGALNWVVVGLFQFDFVATLFGGADSVTSRLAYVLLGLSGVELSITWLSRARIPELS